MGKAEIPKLTHNDTLIYHLHGDTCTNLIVDFKIWHTK